MYFRREEYASFWVRLLATLIDLIVFGVVLSILTSTAAAVVPDTWARPYLIITIWAAIALLYFVVLRRSKFRTLGYRACGIKIVGLDGQTPGYLLLTYRLSVGVACALNWPLDFMWLSNDSNRQTIHDKFAQTFVVRLSAQPAGQGRIVVRCYDFVCYHLIFREVEPGESIKL